MLKRERMFLSEGDFIDQDKPEDQCFIGKELTFDEIMNMKGQLILYSSYTSSFRWLKVIRPHSFPDNDMYAGFPRNLVYTDGHGERSMGRVCEYWFSEQCEKDYPNSSSGRCHAYRLRRRPFTLEPGECHPELPF